MMLNHVPVTVAWMVALAWMVAGCGYAPSDEEIEIFSHLYFLNGKISNVEALDRSKPLRAALILKAKPSKGKHHFIVEKDIEIDPSEDKIWPFEMKISMEPDKEDLLNVNDLPPEQANHFPKEAKFTTGTIIIYEDSNDNGRLDRLEVGSPKNEDYLLGVNQWLAFWFFSTKLPNDEFFKDKQYPKLIYRGYKVLQLEEDCFPNLDCPKGKWLNPITLQFGRLKYVDLNRIRIADSSIDGACFNRIVDSGIDSA